MQRDATQNLGEFESIAFREVKKICLVPLYQLLSLDEEISGKMPMFKNS